MIKDLWPGIGLSLALALFACSHQNTQGSHPKQPAPAGTEATPAKATTTTSGEKPMTADHENPETSNLATFGAGCFWCVEAVLEQQDGVEKVMSGYMGGHVKNPTYEQVCTGETGHAEVVQVTFDPKRISYEKLLAWFWKLHDPTTLNRQGNDVGTQYRSVIFYHTDAQKNAAQASRAALERSGAFDAPIVTEIAPAGPLYPAEDYHQDYYRNNKAQPYCRAVIRTKLQKLDLEH